MTRTIIGMLITVSAVAAAHGQSPDASPQFEVASIKLAPPPNGMFSMTKFVGGPGTPDPGLFRCENCSLSMLIIRAYELKDYQLSGPDWMETTRFNISAKLPGGATKEQFRLMQQNLLVERFKLTFRHEKKEVAGYQLVLAKNGPKLKESGPLEESQEVPAPRPPSGPPKTDSNGYPILPPGRGPLMLVLANGRATMRSVAESMPELAARLSDQLRRPVADATGLMGKYDFVLNWVIEGPGYSGDDTGPTLFGALQEQLGLKLEPRKLSGDIFVVDHLEKTPSEN